VADGRAAEPYQEERMTGIVEFLTARLRDDEAYALNAAADVSRNWSEPFSGAVQFGGQEENPECEMALTYDSGISRHMVRHDPARVLREVAAKRRVLERHYADQDGSCVGCGFNSVEERMVEDINDCPELRDLASVYDSHPDHKQEWKPIVEFVRREDYFWKPPALPPGWATAPRTLGPQEGDSVE
jgi:uncharacterized protein DUF6221